MLTTKNLVMVSLYKCYMLPIVIVSFLSILESDDRPEPRKYSIFHPYNGTKQYTLDNV